MDRPDHVQSSPGLEGLPETVGGGEQYCVGYAGANVRIVSHFGERELTVSLLGILIRWACTTWLVLEILANPNPIPGCTYGNAANCCHCQSG